MRQILLLVLYFIPVLGLSQDITGTELELNRFYTMVKENHPVARQAILIGMRGKMAIREARGYFDPKLVSDFNKKSYDSKDYYDTWNTYLEVPTLLNIDLKAGYEINNGLFLNPENAVPNDGLYYAGLSVPLGQGMIYNQRNIGLKKSKFESRNFENEARIVLNNLLLDANHAYWFWYESYQKQKVVEGNLELINIRFEGVKQAVLNGENAAIDSVETLIQVQQWANSLRKAEVDFKNSVLLLQNFTWGDSLSWNSIKPEYTGTLSSINLDDILQKAITEHPILNQLVIEGNLLELDRKLGVEQLKPVIDLNYNFLLTQGTVIEQPEYFMNNYKFGFDFNFPLLIRKERAKLKLIKLKQQENDLKLNQKNREILNKVKQSYNKVLTLRNMIEQQELILENYQRMLTAEQIKFDNGESSIFLLNSRENKKLESEIKLIELKAQYGRAIGELKWSAGILDNEISQ